MPLRVKIHAAPRFALSLYPPTMAVLPSALSETLKPRREFLVAFAPVKFPPSEATNLAPCWLQVDPLRVKIHAAPRNELSADPPTMAVEPSALSETVKPRAAEPLIPVPTNLAPCCVFGAVVALSVKVAAEVTDPLAVVNDIVPVADPGMTIPTRLVPVLEMTMAAVPPMVKAVGVSRLVPSMVTNVPTEPLLGENDVIVG